MRRLTRTAVASLTIAATLVLSLDSVSGEPPIAATFHGLTPARLADTRPNGSTVDGLESKQGPLQAGATLDVVVVGRGGVPSSGVGSVALNVTAINPTAASFLTVYPTGNPRPLASNLNLAPGRTLPNMVIVPVGTGGKITVYNDQGSTNLAIDVLGWFPTQYAFTGLTPGRLADTRANGQTVDGAAVGTGTIGAGGVRSVPIRGRGGVPLFGVGAVALNVTAINPTAASFLTVYPTGNPRPLASNLNLAPGRTLPNMVIVPLGTDGSISLYNDQGATHVAVDVLGWFPATEAFTGLTPARLADTRANGQTVDGQARGGGAIPPGGTLDVPTLARGGMPASGIGSVALNVTAINPTAASFLTVYPTGNPRPLASNLNLAPGRTLPNMVIVPVGADGKITVYNDQGSTHVAVDVLGWFPATVVAPSTTRVSLSSSGVQANQEAFSATLSADGRFVAFGSSATTLVPNDGNNTSDIFVHDRMTRITERVNVSSAGDEANGSSESPAISGDGRFVAFVSVASNLVPDDGNGRQDVFVRDRHLGTTVRVSGAADGGDADGDAGSSHISADGRFVVFSSDAPNLVPGDSNDVEDVFVHDRVAGTTSRVSLTDDGAQADGRSGNPRISADGRFVAFMSEAGNLVSGDSNSRQDVFVRDRQAGTTTRVSLSSTGDQGTADSYSPSISGNGRYVSFTSSSAFVPDDTNNNNDVFVHDRVAGTTVRVSVASNGAESPFGTLASSLSFDGRYVAIVTPGAFLPVDTNDDADVYVRDLWTGTLELASVATDGTLANGSSAYVPILSGDGRYVAFSSSAKNLVSDDTNNRMDAFVRDRGTG